MSRASLTWRAKAELRFLLHARYDAALVGVSRPHMENIRDTLAETLLLGPFRRRVRLDYVYNPIPEALDVSAGAGCDCPLWSSVDRAADRRSSRH